MTTQTTHDAASSTKPAVLVIGATGGVGGEVARQLIAKGWQVRALTRHADTPRCPGMEQVTWHHGDAMNAEDVRRAAQGVAFIVHAANPPRYHRWRETAMPMLANAIEAARAHGARLIMPGNVYNFGPDAGSHVTESSPQHPLTRKGQVRVEMEGMLREAAKGPRPVRSLVLRAGDFFGAHAPSSWFQNLLVKPGRPVKSVMYPGVHDVGHTWAYLPDLATTMIQLMALDLRESDKLATCEVLHFGGHWLAHGIEMAEAISRIVSPHAKLPIKSMPWFAVTLASPFVEVLREMREMRYLWQVPLRLDNRKLVALLGREPHTPLDQAVRASLSALGCLGPQYTATPVAS